MSTNRASAPPITNSDAGSRSNKRSRPSELTDLDAKLKNISNHIIQPSPYLLTVPTDYRKGRSQANDWMKNTPFAANEEPVQYVSFLRDWDGGIITPVGGWDNDKGEIMDSAQQRQPARSSTSTPTVNPKKITLSDYKKKAAGQSTSNGASAMNGKHSKEGHTNGATSAPNSVSSASKKPEIVHKR